MTWSLVLSYVLGSFVLVGLGATLNVVVFFTCMVMAVIAVLELR
jgi:hypothetical protein